MGAIEDIQKMQQEGLSEKDIISSMQKKGLQDKEIYEALSQAKIKEAVTGDVFAQAPFSEEKGSNSEEQISMQEQGMEPSMMSSLTEAEYVPESQYRYSQEQYPEYQQELQPSISSDTITEISEQIISEKISPLKNEIKKIIDLKNTFETKVEILDERLKRIERTIDKLQSAILQKVGDYVTNTEDIKKELIETQKSFKALIPELSKHKHHEHK